MICCSMPCSLVFITQTICWQLYTAGPSIFAHHNLSHVMQLFSCSQIPVSCFLYCAFYIVWYYTGRCLEKLCQAAPACPDVAMPFICNLLEVIPNICAHTNAMLDLQQQLPFSAVGVSLLLSAEVAGKQLDTKLYILLCACSEQQAS